MYELEFTSLGSADMMKDLNGGDHRIQDMTLQKCAAKCDGFDYIAMTSGAPVARHPRSHAACIWSARSFGQLEL